MIEGKETIAVASMRDNFLIIVFFGIYKNFPF